uniref:DNA-directed RNA polymerase subunit 5 n=1 Tax=Mimivirus LCMiAC02 TaxID=2506609 RepID=A0A481Z302_9VIRU|nr:MAG: DNA-directed RNA polymerase subunit 5 [Mimivirus LCMiAC02]
MSSSKKKSKIKSKSKSKSKRKAKKLSRMSAFSKKLKVPQPIKQLSTARASGMDNKITQINKNTLIKIKKSKEDIRKIVLTNVIKMLTERKLLDENKISDNIKNIVQSHPDNMIYELTLKNKNQISILLYLQTVTSIKKIPAINNFLNDNKNAHKIIIVKNINKKAIDYINNNNINIEIFKEGELMRNLVENILVSKYTILSKTDAQKLLEEYKCKAQQLPFMFSIDPVAKYYNMKIGDISRTIRPSATSGKAVSYRLVISSVGKKK